jgi:hypothetical protein
MGPEKQKQLQGIVDKIAERIAEAEVFVFHPNNKISQQAKDELADLREKCDYVQQLLKEDKG